METPRGDGNDRENTVTNGKRIDLCVFPPELYLEVIGYLPLQDIITCERVSEKWQNASKQCMEDKIRTFKKEDPLYAPGGVLQTEIQEQAPEIHFPKRHFMRTGNARNFLELSSALLASSGYFTYWVENPQGFDGPSHTLHWTARPKQDTSVRDQVTASVSADCLWPDAHRPLTIYDIMCNEDGDVVYMALDKEKERIKWVGDYKTKYWNPGEIPACLLGKSSIYVAQPPGEDGRCHLRAYDIESRLELWDSDKTYSWNQNDRSMVLRRGLDKARPRVIQTGHVEGPELFSAAPKRSMTRSISLGVQQDAIFKVSSTQD